MTSRPCRHVDDYLTANVDPSAAEDFRQHLETCQQCRDAVAFERQLLERLLDASHHLEQPPLKLTADVRRLVRTGMTRSEHNRSSSEQSGRRAVALLVAAGLLISAGLFLAMSSAPVASRTPLADNIDRQHPALTEGIREPAIEGTLRKAPVVKLANTLLGVPVRSDDPNLTILLVYPVLSGRGRADDESIPTASTSDNHVRERVRSDSLAGFFHR